MMEIIMNTNILKDMKKQNLKIYVFVLNSLFQ